ncbi:putative quinol monooxygenase [Mucilaginibacter phyllosphaerae]
MSIYLTALIKSKAGQAQQMKGLLLDLVAGSKTETACLQYDLHQSQDDENIFIFHEEWASQAGLDEHNTQPHIQKFIAVSAEIMDGTVTIYKTQRVA